MSKQALNKTFKLEDSSLWRVASGIAKEAYINANELPDDEKWGMQSKLRTFALNLSSDVAEAVGTDDPRTWHYNLTRARGAVFGIKNIYKLAYDADMLELVPETMVQLDELTKLLDREIVTFPEARERWDKLRGFPEKKKGKA